jgi:hypothetical protein
MTRQIISTTGPAAYAIALTLVGDVEPSPAARYAWQVGGHGGPIFADFAAAERFRDRKRAKDASIAAHKQAKQAAARVLANAASKATANVTRGRRVFGAGLEV